MKTSDKLLTAICLGYTASLGIRGELPAWVLSANISHMHRKQTGYLYPYYRRQDISSTAAELYAQRNLLTKGGVLTVGAGLGYLKGSGDAGGIATTRIDTIRFSATLADDGSCLRCHADTLIIYDGKAISADWTATTETDETSGARRLCWILSSETPVATLSNGQHLYLLSENIQTSRLEGMTLRSDEKSDDEMTFKFPQNQEVYAVLSADKPFAGSASAFLEIWASARFIHSRR